MCGSWYWLVNTYEIWTIFSNVDTTKKSLLNLEIVNMVAIHVYKWMKSRGHWSSGKRLKNYLNILRKHLFVLLEGVGCKEKESLNILFIPFLLCWNCRKKNGYSDFLGRRFWKKQEDINTCKIKNWKKSLSLVGCLGENFLQWTFWDCFCKICHILREDC